MTEDAVSALVVLAFMIVGPCVFLVALVLVALFDCAWSRLGDWMFGRSTRRLAPDVEIGDERREEER